MCKKKLQKAMRLFKHAKKQFDTAKLYLAQPELKMSRRYLAQAIDTLDEIKTEIETFLREQRNGH